MKQSARNAAEKALNKYLDKKGRRRTPERIEILDAVYSMGGHFTISELYKSLEGDRHFHVSLATVYNTLGLFLKLGIVVRHRFQGSTKYEAYIGGDTHSHQICTLCGKVTEVKAPEIVKAVDNLKLWRFRKEGYALYIYGVCSSCQGKKTRRLNGNDKGKQQKQDT